MKGVDTGPRNERLAAHFRGRFLTRRGTYSLKRGGAREGDLFV